MFAAWTGARLAISDPKHFPSFDKLMGRAKPVTKQQSEADMASNLRAWAMVIKHS